MQQRHFIDLSLLKIVLCCIARRDTPRAVLNEVLIFPKHEKRHAAIMKKSTIFVGNKELRHPSKDKAFDRRPELRLSTAGTLFHAHHCVEKPLARLRRRKKHSCLILHDPLARLGWECRVPILEGAALFKSLQCDFLGKKWWKHR